MSRISVLKTLEVQFTIIVLFSNTAKIKHLSQMTEVSQCQHSALLSWASSLVPFHQDQSQDQQVDVLFRSESAYSTT